MPASSGLGDLDKLSKSQKEANPISPYLPTPISGGQKPPLNTFTGSR